MSSIMDMCECVQEYKCVHMHMDAYVHLCVCTHAYVHLCACVNKKTATDYRYNKVHSDQTIKSKLYMVNHMHGHCG